MERQALCLDGDAHAVLHLAQYDAADGLALPVDECGGGALRLGGAGKERSGKQQPGDGDPLAIHDASACSRAGVNAPTDPCISQER